ncbi:MAG: hypothetical protein HYU56_05635 [Candidatus Aenigmarchaeota archaeon]|nr:hypothetical protein [Candidatus Aenigmarchaeota archaeon]
MGRKKGFDEKKIAAIIEFLHTNQDGVWIRRIARETGMDNHTVTKYIDTLLRPLIEDVSLAGESKTMLRVVRLKPFVIEKLAEGRSVQQILKILKLINQPGE